METQRSDSARERLGILFDALAAADPSGAWLDRLVARAVGGSAAAVDRVGPPEERAWWPRLRALDAPPALLAWQVRHLRCPSSVEACGPAPALPAHLADGPPAPDAWVATPDAVVVVHAAAAGVEPASACRRVLATLDAALAPAGPRALLGLVVVDGDDDEVPAPWLDACAHARSSDALAETLPHRGPEERAYLAGCFLGCVTWPGILPGATDGDYRGARSEQGSVHASEHP